MEYTTTAALVLHRTRYNDRYSIVHLYSREVGYIGTLVPESSSRKNAIREHLRPLAEVELTLSLRAQRDLARVQEVHSLHPRHSVHMDAAKGAQAIFLSEFLYRVLAATQTADSELYDYIASSLLLWEGLERGTANFHLCFLLQLLPYFGIAPEPPEESSWGRGLYFSLQEQCYLPHRTAYCLTPEETIHLPLFLRMTYATMARFAYSRTQRGVILDYLLDYYRLHFHSFPPLKCLPILRQLGQSAQEA